MNTGEMRELPSVELEGQISKIREKLFKYRFHAGNDEMQRAGEIRGLRKDIARLKTVLQERRIEGKREAGSKTEEQGERD